MILSPPLQEYIRLLKVHCNQYNNLLKSQASKRLALQKRHRKQKIKLCDQPYWVQEMAGLLGQQTKELVAFHVLGIEHRRLLKEAHQVEKSIFLKSLQNHYMD